MLTRRAAVGMLLLCPWADALAQPRYPDQPIKLIVPFPPGGPADIVGRLVGRALGDRLGQPFVVDNRSGAGGTIGMAVVAQAKPDGYTLGIGSTGALTILPHMMPRMPFDPQRDFQPISQVIAVPQVLTVHPSVPARTVAELVGLAKQQPGKLSFASSGRGNSLHLTTELFKLRAGGMDILHVPYRGAAPALTDLVGGQVQMMFGDLPVMLSQIQAGGIVALGVTSQERSPTLPNVPTMAEAGLPGVEAESFYGLMAPAGIPADRLGVLHAALVSALADEQTRRQLVEQGGTVVGNTPEEFSAYINAERAKWGEVVRLSGARLD